MFSYKLEDLTLQSQYDNDGQLRFEPPVYEQRYCATIRILEDAQWNTRFKKVVDFGCAELRLMTLLKRSKELEHILGVDIDGETLCKHKERLNPLISDYLVKREWPLRMELLNGSITSAVKELQNVDAVIGLEIIEHLHADVLDKVPQNIFRFMQPKLAIFSTPNAEFNVLFGPSKLPNGFRHFDHKFEWKRAEFEHWASNICERYPNYSVAFVGVGKPPLGREDVGFVTQIAIFARNDILGRPLAHALDDLPPDTDPNIQYKQIYAVDYPYDHDDRTREQKIWDEACFQIDRYRCIDNYYDADRCICKIPLAAINNFTSAMDSTTTITELLGVLEKHYIAVEGEYIIMPPIDEHVDSSSTECYDKEDYDTAQEVPPHVSDENWD